MIGNVAQTNRVNVALKPQLCHVPAYLTENELAILQNPTSSYLAKKQMLCDRLAQSLRKQTSKTVVAMASIPDSPTLRRRTPHLLYIL